MVLRINTAGIIGRRRRPAARGEAPRCEVRVGLLCLPLRACLGGPGLSPLALGGEGGPRGSERTDDGEMPTTDSEGGSGAELLTAVAAVDDGSGNPREPKGLPTVQSSSAKSRAARNPLPELYSGQSPGVFIDQLPATSGAFHFRFSNRGNGPSTFHFQQPGARAGQEVYTMK